MIDLHTHTTASDGTLSPTELVKRAKKRGVEILAITDHDTVDGLKEARLEADKQGMELINGIELSTNYLGEEVHILGYFVDVNDENFLESLESLKRERETRTEEIIEKLRKNRVEISMEEILKEVNGEIISRTHIALVLKKRGYVRSTKDAFNYYIGSTGKAYIPKKILDPFEAVKLIRKSGGIAFLAHPIYIKLHERVKLELFDKLKDAGLNGVEVYYPGFTEEQINYYKKIANKRDLLLSGGSDFHGGNRTSVEIGDGGVPEEVINRILAYIK